MVEDTGGRELTVAGIFQRVNMQDVFMCAICLKLYKAAISD